MKKTLKSAYLIITSVLIYILHLPFAFAKSATSNKVFIRPDGQANNTSVVPGPAPMPVTRSVYDSLQLGISGLSQQAYEYAKKGFDKLVEQGRLVNDSIIAIVDFSQPSSKKRFYVLDLKNYRVVFNTLVAHGKNSGLDMANSFSNRHESLQSSPGFYVTENTYNGSNGYSLRLHGLDRGMNDNAYERAIVMHGADYVSQSFINSRGYIGRSWGCPAVPAKDAVSIINTLKGGSCLFIYTPTQNYPERSTVLNS
jgi:hypothetical protein